MEHWRLIYAYQLLSVCSIRIISNSRDNLTPILTGPIEKLTDPTSQWRVKRPSVVTRTQTRFRLRCRINSAASRRCRGREGAPVGRDCDRVDSNGAVEHERCAGECLELYLSVSAGLIFNLRNLRKSKLLRSLAK